MKYVLGLDIGISSVGWAVANLDRKRIEDLGVRAFHAAEDPQTKTPLAEPRRLARSTRRRLRRRRGRLVRAKQLFVKYGLLSQTFVDTALLAAKDKPDPWELRAAGLDRPLSGEEFARALFHIARRRGFKSNRLADKKDEDSGKVKLAIQANRQLMQENGYRSVGEMFALHEQFESRKRNTTGSYAFCVDRSLLEDEIRILFKAQREFGNSHATTDFEEEFLEVFAWQMPFASGESLLNKVGECTFEPGEKRAPRNCYTAERFVLLERINSKLSWVCGGEKCVPTAEQRSALVDLAYSKKELKYSQIRKFLSLPEEARFTGLTYVHRKNGEFIESADCEKTVFVRLQGYKEIEDICGRAGAWDDIKNDPDTIDLIAYALTFYKNNEDISGFLSNKGIPQALIDEACKSAGFSGVTRLSIKAMRKIIPFLEEGCVYSVACEKAGWNHYSPKGNSKSQQKLPVIDHEEVRNPVVFRALTQARKVVNAVIDKYGSPYQINIELAREVGKTPEERAKLTKRIKDNEAANVRDAEHFEEIFGMAPRTGEDRLKWRLYREQGGKCAYSLKPIDLENRFFEPGYVEIDHVLPYSRSFDDSISNKVLVLCSENQNKRNRTPFEYFGHDSARWSEFESWVNATIKDPRKRRNMLMTEYGEAERIGWIPRNLVDTQYIARQFSQYLRNNLLFADSDNKMPVVCVSGGVVAMLRGLWGLSKVREDNDLHHALDACVIASVTPRLIRLVTEYRKTRETMPWSCGDTYVDPETGEVIDFKFSFPQPWKGFRKEVEARLSDDPEAAIEHLGLESYADNDDVHPIIVSRKPVRKVTGPAHKETIRSIRLVDGERMSVVRTDLTSLKLKDLDRLYAPETNQKLYAAIRERLEMFGGDAAKAFAEPLHKPLKDGSPGPIVRKVKLIQPQPSGVEVRGGIAERDSMARLDIYTKPNKNGKTQFYAVPIYAYDFLSGELPEIDGEFLFSLHRYDLVRLVRRGEVLFGYYRMYDISTESLTICKPNDVDVCIRSIGIRNLQMFEKHEMGVLGDYHLVRGEKRRGLADGGDIEPHEASG